MATTELFVDGMTCNGCSSKLTDNFLKESGISKAEVSHVSRIAKIEHSEEIKISNLEEIVTLSGFSIGERGFDWNDKKTWLISANNTKWCLIGCSIGEFGTLAYYTYSGVTLGLEKWSAIWLFYLLLPLINGLITSIMLETIILMRDQMDFKNALSTALGMSFISMLMMEIAMLITDLLFTKGEVGLMPIAIPFMLIVGFLTPWPYNYWRLKKYGKSCH